MSLFCVVVYLCFQGPKRTARWFCQVPLSKAAVKRSASLRGEATTMN